MYILRLRHVLSSVRTNFLAYSVYLQCAAWGIAIFI